MGRFSYRWGLALMLNKALRYQNNGIKLKILLGALSPNPNPFPSPNFMGERG